MTNPPETDSPGWLAVDDVTAAIPERRDGERGTVAVLRVVSVEWPDVLVIPLTPRVLLSLVQDLARVVGEIGDLTEDTATLTPGDDQ